MERQKFLKEGTGGVSCSILLEEEHRMVKGAGAQPAQAAGDAPARREPSCCGTGKGTGTQMPPSSRLDKKKSLKLTDNNSVYNKSMKSIKKLLLSALILCGGVCATYAQEKTTTAGVPVVKLNNGVEMPRFGIGTFLQPSDEVCEQSCLTALKAGYRHIDTAHAYQDEAGVGSAVKESGIPREEIWITSKLWPTEYGEGKTLKAIDEMLERMQLDYIDLLYVHQPVGDFVGAWKDMEKAVQMGKVRALGISNFDASDEVWNTIMKEATVKPQVLQIECHPYAQRLEMRKKAAKEGIQVECWFPLGGAMSDGALFKDPVIRKIAEAHGKTPAQVILRWHIQEGFSVIPGASNPDYIKENIQIFDFALTDEEMRQMRSLNKEKRFFNATLEDVEKMVWSAKL